MSPLKDTKDKVKGHTGLPASLKPPTSHLSPKRCRRTPKTNPGDSLGSLCYCSGVASLFRYIFYLFITRHGIIRQLYIMATDGVDNHH